MPLAIEQLLLKYPELFCDKLERAGNTAVDPIDIHVPHGKQVYVPPRPINQALLSDLRIEIEGMAQAGVIEPSTAKHNTPLLVVKKPNGKLRICADLRALNRICENFTWEFPRLDLAISRMKAASVFSKIDLTSGFWQLRLNRDSRDFTTFRFDGRTWRFCVVPFGWKGAPAAFQAAMDTVLQKGIHDCFLTVYMDDLLIHSRNEEEHVHHLGWTLDTLSKHGFKLNPEKFSFGVAQIEFLGHLVSAGGITQKPDKLDVIANMKAKNFARTPRLARNSWVLPNLHPKLRYFSETNLKADVHQNELPLGCGAGSRSCSQRLHSLMSTLCR